MGSPQDSFAVRTHVVGIERVDRNLYRVSVDGRRLASFCTESRARAAGRLEAARLDFVAREARDGGPGAALPRADGAWRRA
jgi:hypothetical protein